ncbi:MAG: apolipoprotein N-acyltransferase [Planctomycetota bacterium]
MNRKRRPTVSPKSRPAPPRRFTHPTVLLPLCFALTRYFAQAPWSLDWLVLVCVIPLIALVESALASGPRTSDGTDAPKSAGSKPASSDSGTAGSDQESGSLSGKDPLLHGHASRDISPIRYRWIWIGGFLFWLLSLQGLRHAHPLMIVPLILLSAYLSVYGLLFVCSLRRLRKRGWPLIVAAPLAWVGWEYIRNHFATGLSVCMLGHTMANHPTMIQIAGILGTYGVSFVVVTANVGIFESVRWLRSKGRNRAALASAVLATTVLLANVIYGRSQLASDSPPSDIKVALIGLDEQTEYIQDENREQEIFAAYARQSARLVREEPADPPRLIVWPESMYSGAMPWMTSTDDAIVPEDAGVSQDEFRISIQQWQAAYLRRADDLQFLVRSSLPNAIRESSPGFDFIAGGGVIEYGDELHMYSGLIHVATDSDASSPDNDAPAIHWYGKNHRVMVGEYIPLVSSLPLIRDWIPGNLRLTAGKGGKMFEVDGHFFAANICIETAVERVAVNHLHQWHRTGTPLPEAILTVTNDAWFDHSSVVEHHLRCGQLLAAGCRRPILSAGNGGPTAWINHRGQIVDRIPTGGSGHIIVQHEIVDQTSPYIRWGDWPAAIPGWLVAGLLAWDLLCRRRSRASARQT